MAIRIRCHACQSGYRLRDSAAGRIIRCQKCAESIRVPTSAQESRTKVDHPKAAQLRCPACPDSGLHALELNSGVLVDSCPKCRGTWLDAGELLQMSRNKETARQGTVAVAWEPIASDRACPQCKIPMHEGESLDSDVFLDCCGNCDGLWFDAKELDANAGNHRL